MYMRSLVTAVILGPVALFSFCNDVETPPKHLIADHSISIKAPLNRLLNDSGVRTVHVLVALCDNKYQGIVPVGQSIGNGQDADNNLYWGCAYGVRTWFKRKSSDWILLESRKNPSDQVLEQLLFKHKTASVYLLADAYDGRFIQQTTIDFLQSASGNKQVRKIHKKDTFYFGGSSSLLAYIGHDGLMDFQLPLAERSNDTTKKETIILACYSKRFFAPHLRQTNATPLVWTTGLMAPEAYTLHDALAEWVMGKSENQIREAAANAYAKYQKCSRKAAMNLLVSGW